MSSILHPKNDCAVLMSSTAPHNLWFREDFDMVTAEHPPAHFIESPRTLFKDEIDHPVSLGKQLISIAYWCFSSCNNAKDPQTLRLGPAPKIAICTLVVYIPQKDMFAPSSPSNIDEECGTSCSPKKEYGGGFLMMRDR
jgi:hypothetical protein